ncbi:hypothetical protein PENTCL1PPCAC_15534, partial [Pristionchus entomophagus]
MQNISLHPLWHTVMLAYQHFLGAVTHALSALAFYLMITKTPGHGKSFVKYLMLLQVFITLNDLNFGILYCPINLFPVPGWLCNGILCTWFGFSCHFGNAIMYFSFAFISVSIIYCFHYKHVSIGELVARNSVSAMRHSIFRVIILAVHLIPCVFQIGLYRNMESGPDFVKLNFPSMFYLFENPQYRAMAYDTDRFHEY